MKIETRQGDATSPRPGTETLGHGVIVAHLCNQISAWGRGFVLAVDDLSFAAKYAYKALCKDNNDAVPLGTTQFVEVKTDLWVSNMIAQNGTKGDGCLVDYKALGRCLHMTFKRAIQLGCTVHIPSGMGSGLAGGDEAKIHAIIKACANDYAALEKSIGFELHITLWEFQDATAASYVAPKVSNQTMASSVLGAATDTSGDTSGDTDDIDSILEGL